MTTRAMRWRFVSLLSATLGLCGLLCACASSRLLKNPLPATAPDLGWTASAPEGLTIEVDQLIVRNSGGSWVRDANWDEYVLTVANKSPDWIEIRRVDLYSDRLPAPEESSTSREQLEARTSTTLRTLKDAGIIAGVGVVAPAALIAGAVGTSGGFMAASGGAAAVAAVGVVAIPVGLIGGTTYVITRRRRAKEDKVLIERKLVERGFGVPAQILPDMQVRKSVFFPVTPSPTRLVVDYISGGDSRELSLALPALAGLHLKAVRKPTASDQVPGPIH
jgi:hypothetical protein